MSHFPADMSSLPALDTHAHIAPDITEAQVRQLADAVVFAMTRTLEEADYALRMAPAGLVWGVGVHPGREDALRTWDRVHFSELLDETWLVGEVGLDSRGDRVRQREVFEELLGETSGRACLLSIHSQGRVPEVLELLGAIPQVAPVLHWFGGTKDQLAHAVELGAYFSVNAAMSDEIISAVPSNRALPETDFPSSRKRTGARLPADCEKLEQTVSRLRGIELSEVRSSWYTNLASVASFAPLRGRVLATPRLGEVFRSTERD